MKSETFFSAAENEEITRTIQEVELQTSGEVAVMVVGQSDSYPESRILAGVIIGCLLSLGVTDLLLDDSLWGFLPLAATFSLFIARLTDYLPLVKRFFVPGVRLEEMVREQAVQGFFQQGLYKTREATGVLFFISLFERRVWVLADQGINEKISQESLQTYAADIAKGIKEGRAAEALCQEIRRAGTVLAEHFPVRDDDINELPDQVMHG
jgi:putative membrane protein